jgi:DNA invertase Pin-like site-specific DNA recombinase
MLLSFAQFEREITGERIRDKVAASKRKGIWMGGAVPLGYRVEDRALRVVERRLSSSAPSIAATSKLAAWCASRLLSTPRTFTPPPG